MFKASGIKWTPQDRRTMREAMTSFTLITEDLGPDDTKVINSVFDGDLATLDRITRVLAMLDQIDAKCDADLAYFDPKREFTTGPLKDGQVALIEDPKIAQQAICEARQMFKERIKTTREILERGLRLLTHPEQEQNVQIQRALAFIANQIDGAGRGQMVKDNLTDYLTGMLYPAKYPHQQGKDLLLEGIVEKLQVEIEPERWTNEFSEVLEGLRNCMSRPPEENEGA